MTPNRSLNMTGLLRVVFTLAAVVACFAVMSAADVARGDVSSAGTVVGWGDNRWGQALPPAGLAGITAVAAGGFHTLGLTDRGTVIAWGDDSYGQASVPAGLTGVTHVAAGKLHSLAREANGTVVAWGYDADGQASVPAGLTGVEQVAAGGFHSLALKADGTVVAWGDNSHGQTNVPAGLTGVTEVAAGGFHSLALKADGTVVSWSDDAYGGTTIPAGLNGVTQVSAGTRHSVALVVDRSVVSFRAAHSTTTENAGVAQLVVTRSNVTDTQATVRYAATGGTATPGVDYTLEPGLVTFAAGQTRATIPVPITNDQRPEAAETITVALSDPGAGTSIGSLAAVTLTIAASDQRPDALISTHPRTGYIGNNIYNLTAAGQTKMKSAPRKATRRLYLRIYNDGNASNTFTLRGSAAPPGSSVRFLDTGLGFDLTRALRSNNGLTVQLPAGDYLPITLRITVASTARIGTIKSVTVTGRWTGDRTRADVVKAQVRVVHR